MSVVDKKTLYNRLYDAYTGAYSSEKSLKICQIEANKVWNDIKKDPNVDVLVNDKVKELNAIKMKKKGGLLKFWANQTNSKSHEPASTSQKPSLEFQPGDVQFLEPRSDHDDSAINAGAGPSDRQSGPSSKAPVQERLKQEIAGLKADLVSLYQMKQSGMITDEQTKLLEEKKKKTDMLEKELKQKEGDMKRQKKARDQRKRALSDLVEKNPDIRTKLRIREDAGRPRVEADQPLLLKTIIDIAVHGSAADDRRRSDVLRSIKTLDELTAELNKVNVESVKIIMFTFLTLLYMILNQDGYQIKRSAVYLRLIPKRSSSLEGQRHVQTVPVKLAKAQNDLHSKHVDGLFCASTIHRLEELASLLGPKEVLFVSQDDKARVPIGLTAANKQAPLLMHVEYRVSLPDHDWVIAARHKLIPSVYAGIVIQPNGLGRVQV